VDFVWLLMSNSELLRIENRQMLPYKRQKERTKKARPFLVGLIPMRYIQNFIQP